ncbi:MAG TPA: bifunctional riboflavin kinase/FAD synthetase [Ktedonobacteraceae bacterium]
MQYQTTLSAHEPIAITIGNFDGIHLGHQRLLHEVGELARALRCKPVLVTFWPHTLLVVRPDIDIRYLTTQDEKLVLAKEYGGIADSIVIAFTPEVAAMSAEDFMNQLCQRFSIQGIVAGADFSLGHNRMGDIPFLEHYGQQHNIRVHTVSLAEAHQNRISSSRIRMLLSQGDIAQANELLGHPVIVSGIVRQGAKRGRLLGFPTANVHPEPRKLLPADGVYAAIVHVQENHESDLLAPSSVYKDVVNISTSGGGVEDSIGIETVRIETYKSVVNIGIRPTFNEKERLVEVHLLDADLNLYDRKLTIEFIQRLRGEQRFPSIDALKVQISADVQEAHHILTVRRVSN